MDMIAEVPIGNLASAVKKTDPFPLFWVLFVSATGFLALANAGPWFLIAGRIAAREEKIARGKIGFERRLLEKVPGTRRIGLGEKLEIADLYGEDQAGREIAERKEFFKELSQFTALEDRDMRSVPQGLPAYGKMTSRFGRRFSPFDGGPRFHSGVDIAGDEGAPIVATADGTVEYAEWKGSYGNLVVINHGFGYITCYGHNSEIGVKPGETVKRGQMIAAMGSSGSSTGTHIHYEVWHYGRCVNPSKYLNNHAIQDWASGKSKNLSRSL